MQTNSLAEKIVEAMKAQIEKYGLDVLKRYPDDLLVHDFAVLQRAAVPGMSLGWMVGHAHTHLVQLGLHEKENEMVGCLTNLCNDDRFYHIAVGGGGFAMVEMERSKFAALESTSIPYRREGSSSEFSLYRGKERVGYVAIAKAGSYESPIYEAKITPIGSFTKKDEVALQLWCSRAIIEAGTLFAQSVVTWQPPVQRSAIEEKTAA